MRGRCFGRQAGFGSGPGAGWRRLGRWSGGGYPASTPEENLEEMKRAARELENELEALRTRIDAFQRE